MKLADWVAGGLFVFWWFLVWVGFHLATLPA